MVVRGKENGSMDVDYVGLVKKDKLFKKRKKLMNDSNTESLSAIV